MSLIQKSIIVFSIYLLIIAGSVYSIKKTINQDQDNSFNEFNEDIKNKGLEEKYKEKQINILESAIEEAQIKLDILKDGN